MANSEQIKCVRHREAHSPFVKLRNILIGAAALALPLLAVASPAGASTPHPKFINTIHRVAPATKHVENKVLVALGEQVCYEIDSYALGFTPSAQQVLVVADYLKGYDDRVGDPVAYKHLGLFLVDSVVYLCPSYDSILQGFEQQYATVVGTLGIGTVVSSLVRPPPVPKYMGNAATAYQNGYSKGYAGGSLWESGSATPSEGCQAVASTVLLAKDEKKSDYVAGCIAGVIASNNGGLGYDTTPPPPPPPTTATTTLPPTPGNAAAINAAIGSPVGVGSPWQPAPQALVTLIDQEFQTAGYNTSLTGSQVYISQDSNSPQWYEVMLFILVAPGDDSGNVASIVELVNGHWNLVSELIGNGDVGCNPTTNGPTAVPASVESDFAQTCSG